MGLAYYLKRKIVAYTLVTTVSYALSGLSVVYAQDNTMTPVRL